MNKTTNLFDCWIVDGNLESDGLRYIKDKDYKREKVLSGVTLDVAQEWHRKNVYRHGKNASIFITFTDDREGGAEQ